MKRYLAMLGVVTLLALPAVVSAETNDQPTSVQRTSDVGRLAELLARKGVITQQELTEVAPVTTEPANPKTDQAPRQPIDLEWIGSHEVSAPVTTAPANAKTDQESDLSWVKTYAGDERSYKSE